MYAYLSYWISMVMLSFFPTPSPNIVPGCEITIEEITVGLCDDNNTPSDETDDFYSVFVNASAIQGSSNNTFEVMSNGLTLGSFQYDTGGTISLPINTGITNLDFTDTDDFTCTASDVVGPLLHCSNGCPAILSVTDAPIPSGLYEASVEVNSEKNVKAGFNVTFQAGQCILLNSGFTVDLNGEFEAVILDCSN